MDMRVYEWWRAMAKAVIALAPRADWKP